MYEYFLDQLQKDIAKWHDHNFGDTDQTWRALIICEEAGELAHVILKQAQGIRPETSSDEHLRDAIGDIGVALMALCASRQWSFSDILSEVSTKVLKREWKQ